MTDNTSTQRFYFDLLQALSGQSNILTVPRHFITMFGSLEAALFFSQCLFWTDKGDDPAGWIHKTADEWEQETTLTYYQINKLSEVFVQLGMLEVKVKKHNNTPKLHFRVNKEATTFVLMEYFKTGAAAVQTKKTSKKRAAAADKQAAVEADNAALAPSTEGGYILFNTLADEFKAKHRRAPVRFGSLTQKARFEKAEARLGDQLETALTSALSIPLLALGKIIPYLENYGTDAARKKFNKETQAPAAQPPATRQQQAESYDSELETKRAAARAAIEAAAQQKAAA